MRHLAIILILCLSCNPYAKLLDPNSGEVIKCGNGTGTLVFRTVDGKDQIGDTFKMDSCYVGPVKIVGIK